MKKPSQLLNELFLKLSKLWQAKYHRDSPNGIKYMEKELRLFVIFYIEKTPSLPDAFSCLDCHSMRYGHPALPRESFYDFTLLSCLLAIDDLFNIPSRITINRWRNNKTIIVPQGVGVWTLLAVSFFTAISKFQVIWPFPLPKVSELFTKYTIVRTPIFFRKHKPWRRW